MVDSDRASAFPGRQAPTRIEQGGVLKRYNPPATPFCRRFRPSGSRLVSYSSPPAERVIFRATKVFSSPPLVVDASVLSLGYFTSGNLAATG